MSIKLNDNYSGGSLNFPRQNITNDGLNIGYAIIWPAQVTHPHESLKIIEGVKYSLVVWTGRSKEEGEFYE